MKKILNTFLFSMLCFGAISQTTIYEAEDALLFGSLSIGNTFEGYSGTGYVGGFAQDGDKILFTVRVSEAGVYELKVGYMSRFGYKENYLIVNGQQQTETLKFPGSTVFTETTYGAINLMAGTNTIEILKWWGYCWVDYIKVGGIGPVGVISFEPSQPIVNKPFTISAAQSYHPNGVAIDTYEWIVNNSEEFTGIAFSYTFSETGRYSIQLLITDVNGNNTRLARNVLVITGIPYASFGFSPNMPQPDEDIIFNASTSIDFNGDIVAYTWDMGDGTKLNGKIVTHQYQQAGNYEVMLAIKDNDDNEVATKSYLFVHPESVYIRGLHMDRKTAGLYEKAEMIFSINNTYENVFDPDEVKVDAIIQTPGGETLEFPCFYFIKSYYDDTRWLMDTTYQYWKLRYSPRETGIHTLQVRVTDQLGTHFSATTTFNAIPGDVKGFIQTDKDDPNFYRHESGEPYFPIGMHMQHLEDQIKHPRWQLEQMQANNANFIRQWIVGNTQLEWTGGRFKGLGYYSPESSMMIDTLLNLFKEHDVYMQLVFNWHGQFSTNVNPNWAGNPYNVNYGGFLDHPREYFRNEQAFEQAKKKFRYIIARWGYSPNIFAWEFFNEVNFCGTFLQEPPSFDHDVANYHREMSSYVASIDIFNHIQTTSSDSKQLKLMDDTDLDVLNYHIYNSNLLGAIRSYGEGLREDVTKPLVLGEFGTPANKDLLRRVFWQGLFIKVPAVYWYVETLIKENWWDAYTALGEFTRNADFAAEGVKRDTLSHNGHEGLVLLSLKGDSSAYGYFYHPDNIPSEENIWVEIPNLDFGWYRLTIMDPETSTLILNDSIAILKEVVRITFAPFSKEMAFSLQYASSYNDPIAVAGKDQRKPYPGKINIDGGKSYDPGNEPISYAWQLIMKPEGSQLTIDDPGTVKFSFEPDEPGIYQFVLVVSTDQKQSLPDTISILSSQRPVAVIRQKKMEVLPNRFAQPDGSESYDPEKEPLTYSWQLISGPQGSNPGLFKTNEPVMAFRSNTLGEYLLALKVYDGISWSEPDSVIISVVEILTATDDPTLLSKRSNVFPNPFSRKVNISWVAESPQKVLIDVADSRGVYINIYQGTSMPGKNEITVDTVDHGITPGVVFIRITTGSQSIVHKALLIN